MCKCCNQQGINFQNILTGFKFKEIPSSRAWAANYSACALEWLLSLVHAQLICIMIHVPPCAYTYTQRNKDFTNNITLALCSDIFCDTGSILVHINDKMMVTGHKIDFLIHSSYLHFDKHHPPLSPCWGLLVHVSIIAEASLLFQILRAALQG